MRHYPVTVVFALEVRDIDAPFIEKRIHELLDRFHHWVEWFDAPEKSVHDAVEAAVLEARETEHSRRYEWADIALSLPRKRACGESVDSPGKTVRKEIRDLRKTNKIRMIERLEGIEKST
jgi:hypothetical protein